MMRLWVQSYARQSTVAPVAVLSAVAHVVVIAGWVLMTMPPAEMAPDSIANRVIYIPPPDKRPSGGTVHEVVHYVAVGLDGPGTGEGPRTMGDARPVTLDQTVGRIERDTALAPPPTPVAPAPRESVFTVLDVDTAVVRSANSAAPAYPLKLLEAHIMGSVSAQYVVDTTGFADTASFRVLRATNQGFVDAVREALPYMRFKPAKIGPLRVRQLVEQQFTFKITDTDTAARVKKP